LKFCEKYLITYDNCQTIIDYHRARCFGENSPTHEESEGGSTTTIRSTTSESASLKHSEVRIDYAEKVGPALSVNYQGTNHVMQMYLGETPSIAVKRFCGMLKFEEHQCTQVRNTFYNLCLDSGIIHDDLMDTEDIIPAAPASKRGDEAHHSTNSPDRNSPNPSPASFFESVGLPSTVADHFKDYWNWVALAIVLFYVIIHQ
jgi:hypothetical protein